MILLIDNNDSFTYNVRELLRKTTSIPVHIGRSSDVTIEEVAPYEHIIFSPGGGIPSDYPLMSQVLHHYDATHAILGICLGHQAICQHYGATLRNLTEVAHGIRSTLRCDPRSTLFHGQRSMVVGRYHSWVAEALPHELRTTATDEGGLIMGVEHRSHRVSGIQFHPESYITIGGEALLHRFIYGVS